MSIMVGLCEVEVVVWVISGEFIVMMVSVSVLVSVLLRCLVECFMGVFLCG